MYIFTTDMVVETQQDLISVMDFGRKLRKPVAIVAPDFKSEALTSLVVNHLKSVLKVVAIKTPVGMTPLPLLEDIASFSGGQVVTQAMG